MNPVLYKNDEKLKKDLTNDFNSAIVLVNRLKDVLGDKKNKRLSSKSVDYDCPSWAFKQAHDNGYVEALTDVLNLLEN